MTTRKIESLLKQHVVGMFQGFTVRDNMLFSTPVGTVLNAVLFDRSSNPESFSRICVVSVPLWLPAPALSLSNGVDLQRLATPEHVNIGTSAYSRLMADWERDYCLTYFAKYGSPPGMLRNLRNRYLEESQGCGPSENNPPVSTELEETLAGANIICGDLSEAIACIDRAVTAYPDDKRTFVLETKKRLLRLRSSVEKGRSEAIAELRRSEAVTIQNLSLHDVLYPARWDLPPDDNQ